MRLFRTLRTFGSALTRIFAALSLTCCLNGAVHFCFCESDPDGCGHACHECTPENEEACDHVSIRIDAPVVPQCDVPVPQVTYAAPVPDAPAFPLTAVTRTRTPAATGPPDDAGRRLARAVRLCPRT